MTVGDFIKTIAKEKGTSAAKIERDLGFSNGYIGTSRDSSFPYERLVKLADYLDVSPEALFYPMMNPLCLSPFGSSMNMTVARLSVLSKAFCSVTNIKKPSLRLVWVNPEM